LRGAASRADAAFVRLLCRRLAVPLIAGRVSAAARARRAGQSMEMSARAARYRFLDSAARRAGAVCIATAHTADDQAETVLLRLLRGSGLGGLGGIPRSGVTPRGTPVIRPLLGVTRREVEAFLRARREPWREDASNRDLAIPRNRVRHELLPLIERTLNPSARRTLCRTAALLRDEDQWLEAAARRAGAQCRAGTSLRAPRLARLHPALARRVVLTWLKERGLPVARATAAAVESALALARGGCPAQRALPGGRALRRSGALLRLTAGRPSGAALAFRVALKAPGRTRLEEAGIEVAVLLRPGIRKPPPRVGVLPSACSISAEAVGQRTLHLRSWRAGDRIAPLGMRGTRKLQDIFTDAKVPRAARARVPVLECAGEIVWVAGYRVARGWEVTSPAAPALQIAVRRRSAGTLKGGLAC
jgi:tRNA(Ile)-lysidine synthase